MAKYLWIGGAYYGFTGGTGATGAESIVGNRIVDQYCFNTPGNWKLFNLDTLTWVYTPKTPVGGDQVVFGSDLVGYNQGERPGWQPAYSPCLFGGFSGGSGAGNWYFRGNSAGGNSFNFHYLYTGITLTPSAIVGTTFNSALTQLYFGVFDLNGSCAGLVFRAFGGYNFPYFGGGITGEIAEWCALRDGVSASFYTISNSYSMFNPQENLKLKCYNAEFVNPRLYAQSIVDMIDATGGWVNGSSGGHINGPQPAFYSGLPGGTYYTGILASKFLADYDIATALLPAGGTGATASSIGRVIGAVRTRYGKGAGIKLRGKGHALFEVGSFAFNTQYFNDLDYRNPYSYIADYGIDISNLWLGSFRHTKAQRMYMSGCTVGAGFISAFPWDILGGGTGTYLDQVDSEIAADFDGVLTGRKMFGLTAGATFAPFTGKLTLEFGTLQLTGATTGQSPQFAIVEDSSLRNDNSQTVLYGDRLGTKTHYATSIQAISALPSSGWTGAFMYMPWALEFAGSARVTSLDNQGAIVRSHQDIDGITNTVRVFQMNMDVSAHMDFSSRNQNFDDWRFGTVTANNQIAGGIVFLDENSTIKGSNGVRLWNTQTRVAPTVTPPLIDIGELTDGTW